MKIEHDDNYIYLHFERFEHANNGKIRKEILTRLREFFGTPSDPEAEEVMHFDRHKKAWKLDLTEENIDKLKEMAMPSREKK